MVVGPGRFQGPQDWPQPWAEWGRQKKSVLEPERHLREVLK